MSVHVRLLDALEYCAFLLFLVWKLTNSMRSRHEEISVMSVSESLEDREENRIFDVCPLVCIQATLVLVHKTFF